MNRITDWFYMCGGNVGVKDIVSAVNGQYDIEVWSEADILEIGKGKSSIDFEPCNTQRWDDFSRDFLTKNNVEKVYYVSVGDSFTDSETDSLMKSVCNVCNGMFCADTADFEPIVR